MCSLHNTTLIQSAVSDTDAEATNSVYAIARCSMPDANAGVPQLDWNPVGY